MPGTGYSNSASHGISGDPSPSALVRSAAEHQRRGDRRVAGSRSRVCDCLTIDRHHQCNRGPAPNASARVVRRKPAGGSYRRVFPFLHAAAKRFMTEQRKAHRVVFEKGFPANMMAIDGIWRRPCTMEDVSDTGAKLTVEGSVERLAMKEFFLVLSSMGTAYRRCELAWVNGDQIGVYFIKSGAKKKKTAADSAARGPPAHSRRVLLV
jgi:hypothetical protein